MLETHDRILQKRGFAPHDALVGAVLSAVRFHVRGPLLRDEAVEMTHLVLGESLLEFGEDLHRQVRELARRNDDDLVENGAAVRNFVRPVRVRDAASQHDHLVVSLVLREVPRLLREALDEQSRINDPGRPHGLFDVGVEALPGVVGGISVVADLHLFLHAGQGENLFDPLHDRLEHGLHDAGFVHQKDR